MAKSIKEETEIRRWMHRNSTRFTDRKTGEVNMTEMVEAWDREVSTGGSTLDSNHVAWDIATEFVEA
jgi:hypothetical protein